MKAVILALLLLQPIVQTDAIKQKVKTFRNHKKFSVQYDRFKDVTDITVGGFYIKNQRRYGRLDTSVMLSFRGQTPPDRIERVYFFFEGPSARVYDHSIVLIDGERFELQNTDQISHGIVAGTRPQAMLIMDWGIFEKLAYSKSSELQIGTAEIRFEDEHLQAFRDLLSLAK